MYYKTRNLKIVLDTGEVASAAKILKFDNMSDPYEDITFWVVPLITGPWTAQLRYNELPVDTMAGADNTPKMKQLVGHFPPNANRQASDADYIKGPTPDLVVTNTGPKRAFHLHIVAKVYGSAT